MTDEGTRMGEIYPFVPRHALQRPKDHPDPLKWDRIAAEWWGNVNAQYNLAQRYDKGQGVPLNHAEAVKWYRKAAEQGHMEARVYLGIKLALGEGAPQDLVSAVMWFYLAEAQGSEEALEALDILRKVTTQAQRAEAQKRADAWRRGDRPTQILGG